MGSVTGFTKEGTKLRATVSGRRLEEHRISKGARAGIIGTRALPADDMLPLFEGR